MWSYPLIGLIDHFLKLVLHLFDYLEANEISQQVEKFIHFLIAKGLRKTPSTQQPAFEGGEVASLKKRLFEKFGC